MANIDRFSVVTRGRDVYVYDHAGKKGAPFGISEGWAQVAVKRLNDGTMSAAGLGGWKDLDDDPQDSTREGLRGDELLTEIEHRVAAREVADMSPEQLARARALVTHAIGRQGLGGAYAAHFGEVF